MPTRKGERRDTYGAQDEQNRDNNGFGVRHPGSRKGDPSTQ